MGSLPDTFFGWLSMFRVSDRDILRQGGLDRLMFLNFLRFAVITFAVMTFVTLPLYPLHLAGSGLPASSSWLDRASIRNLEIRSNGAWLHVVAAWGVSCCVWWSLVTLQHRYADWRLQWFGEMEELRRDRACTISVNGIPKECRTDAALHAFWSNIYGSRIERCSIVKQMPLLRAATGDRQLAFDRLKASLEAWQAAGEAPEDRPTHFDRHRLEVTTVDSISYWAKRLKALNSDVRTYREDVDTRMSKLQTSVAVDTAFVMFRTPKDAHLATQVCYSEDTIQWNLAVAPDSHDIIWNSIGQTNLELQARKYTVFATVVALFLFWFPVVVLINSIANVQTLRLVFPNITLLGRSWLVMIQGFMSTIALKGFMALLPTIFYWLGLMEGCVYESQVQSSIQHRLFLFNFMFVLLVTIVGQSVFSVADQLLTTPSGRVFEVLADALPMASDFYLNYLTLHLLVLGMHLSRVTDIVKFKCLQFVLSTEEAAARIHDPAESVGSLYARWTIVFGIGVVFATVQPVMVPVCGFVFFVAACVFQYRLLYVEPWKWDSGGVHWPQALTHICCALLLFQFTILGVFTRRHMGQTDFVVLALVPLPILSFVVLNHAQSVRNVDVLPLDWFVRRRQKRQTLGEAGEWKYIQPEFEAPMYLGPEDLPTDLRGLLGVTDTDSSYEESEYPSRRELHEGVVGA